MTKSGYDFWILVTLLLILALQIHNPFRPAPQGACNCDESSVSRAGGAIRPTAAAQQQQQQQREAEPLPVYRRAQAAPSTPSAGGAISTDQLLRELDSTQAREQAGVMPGGGVAAPGGSQAGSVLQRRDDFGRLLQTQQSRGLGVVLGVGRGEFALRLLSDWTFSQGVYLVDPYIHVWRGYDDPANVDDRQHQLIYEDLRNRLVQFEGRHVLVRDFSYSFAETYQKGGQTPGAPTFVYWDANPAEEAVKRDLEIWWQLLAPGGIFAGSTYVASVRTAVDRFASQHSVQVHITSDDAPPTWFFAKP